MALIVASGRWNDWLFPAGMALIAAVSGDRAFRQGRGQPWAGKPRGAFVLALLVAGFFTLKKLLRW